MNEILRNYAENLRRQQTARSTALFMQERGNPDEVANALRLGGELQVPPAAVLAQPERFQMEAEARRTSEIFDRSPRLREWIENDPINGQLAGDDLASLAEWEAMLGNNGSGIGNAVRRGTLQVRAGANVAGAMFAGSDAAQAGQSYEQILSQLADAYGGMEMFGQLPTSIQARLQESAQIRFDMLSSMTEDDALARLETAAEGYAAASDLFTRAQALPVSDRAATFRDGTLANAENTFSGTLGAFFRDPVNGAIFLAETAAETLPVLAGATAATAVARNPAAGAMVMTGGSFLREQSSEAMAFLQERGVDISTPEAALAALSDPALLDEAAGRGLTRGIIIGVLDGLSGGIAGQTLMDNPAGDMVAQALAQGLLAGTGEAGAQLATDGEISPQDVVIEALAELVTLPIEVAGVGGRIGIPSLRRTPEATDLDRAEAAGTTAATLQQIDQMAAQTQTRTRSPDRFAQYLERVGAAEQSVYVPAADFREYAQSQNLNDEEIAALGIDAQEMSDMEQSGGYVAVPLNEYAARIAGTPAAEWFQQNGVLDPATEMSLAMAQREGQSLMDEAMEQARQMRESERELQQTERRVYDEVREQLRQAGRTPDVADSEATFFTAFFNTMAARYGADPFELYERFGLLIQDGAVLQVDTAESVTANLADTQTLEQAAAAVQRTPEFEAWFGDSAVRDANGAPLVVYHGTAENIQAFQDFTGGEDGFYFSSSPDVASGYAAMRGDMVDNADYPDAPGANVIPAYLSLQNPLIVDMGGSAFSADGVQDAVDRAREAGNDGVVFRNMVDPADGQPSASADTIIAFDPSQIKSIFNERPTSDPRILYQGDINDTDFSGPGPYVMRAFHGTTHDFEEFNASIRGTREGHFGAVNYFTSSQADAAGNYGAEGQDLTNRITQRAEQIVRENDWEYDDPRAADMARQEIAGGDERVLEVFIRTERPFLVGGNQSPFVEFIDFSEMERQAIERVAEDEGLTVEEIEQNRDDYEDQIDDARFEIEGDTPNPLIEAVQTVAARYDADTSDLLDRLYEVGSEGTTHSQLEDMLRASETVAYAEDPETGDLVGYHMLAEIIKELGFDSIILKDAAQRLERMDIEPGTAHVQVFDEFNTNIKSVENRGTFDRSDPRILYQGEGEGGPRANIQIPAAGVERGTTVINLFEGRDLSSVIHEGGHYFYEVFATLASDANAPNQMKADLATLQSWMGIQPGQALTTEAHEKMARGMERYVMEGKAPSLELATVFGRFKAWLTNVYRTVRRLNVSLTPEVREVFDRMLATDEAIAQAQADMGGRPMFAEAPANMEQGTWETYQRLERQRTDQANQKMLDKAMDDVRRRREQKWKDERAALVEREMDNLAREPVYRLFEALANQKWIGNEEAELPPRINRDTLEAMGVDLNTISRNVLGGGRAIYTTQADEAGMHPREAAEFFGFPNVGRMIEQLQDSGKRAQRAEERADAVMAQMYPDLLDDASMQAEALEAVHSSRQAEMVALELRHIARQRGQDERRIAARFFQQRARAMIGQMEVRQAVNPNRFLTAERQAARKAEQAFATVARGGRTSAQALAEAQQAKEQQLLNHYLYLEARDLERTVKRKREEMRSYDRQQVRERVGSPHIEQIDAILSAYEFRQRSQRQIDKSMSLARYVELMDKGGVVRLPSGEEVEFTGGRLDELAIDPRVMEDAQRTHYTRLTVDELRGVFDTVDNIAHVGRRTREVVTARGKRLLGESAMRVANQIRDNQRLRRSPEGAGAAWQKFVNGLSRVDTIAVRMDGGEEFGTFHSEIKKEIDIAQGEEQARSVEMMERVQETFARHYSNKELRDIKTERLIPGAGTWTKEQLLVLALNTGTESNFQRIMDPRVDESVRMTGDRLDRVLGTLDERDWRFAQDVLDLIDSYYPELAAVNRRMTGVDPKKVEARPMWPGAPAFFRGGYYRLFYDADLGGGAENVEVQNLMTQGMSTGFGASAQVGNGMTKTAPADRGRQGRAARVHRHHAAASRDGALHHARGDGQRHGAHPEPPRGQGCLPRHRQPAGEAHARPLAQGHRLRADLQLG
jgi:hypothetical protein